MDTTSLIEQEGTEKEKGMDVLGDRGTRSPPGWSNEIRLTNSSGDSTTPDMAVWGSNVHVVWSDDRDGNYEIYYKRSVDNGLNWSNDTQLTFTSYDQYAPKIAVYGNYIHVVWYSMNSGMLGDGSVYYFNSTDNGDNWGGITAWDWTSYSPPSGPTDELTLPDVTVNGNNVYIVAHDTDYDHVIFKRSSDNGDSWTNWILVAYAGSPVWWVTSSIEISGSLLHILYEIDAGSGDFLYHFFSYDQGDTWIDDMWNPVFVADTANKGEMLTSFATSMEGNNFRIVYSLYDGGIMITIGTFTMYWQSGLWYGPYTVSDNGEGDVDVNKDHIVWNGKDANNDHQLYSSKYGQVTDHPSNSSMPTIMSSGDIVHVIWVDDRDGNNELYYSQRGMLADLTLDNSNIQFDPLSPVVNGTTIFTNATVLSYSKSVSNVEVKFYNGDPDTNNDLIPDPIAVEIGNDTINVNKDSSALASIQWTPPSIGAYTIYVWVDPNNNTQEYNYSNNLANITLEVIPGIFSQVLWEGWNLISIPLELSENNLTSLFQPIQGQYDVVQWYNLTDTNDNWKHYHISKPSYFNDLKYVDEYKGLWLHITEPGGTTLTIIDNKITTSQNISLYPGWNLVGYPSLTSYNRTEGLNNLTFGSEVDSIWTYEATTQKWEEIGQTDYFEVGRGYWFHSKVEKTWEVPL